MSSDSESEPELRQSVNAADLPRCVECGGFGVGLVTNPQRLCTHCARVTKTFFDPNSSKFCTDEGFVDISPAADGGVLKKVAQMTATILFYKENYLIRYFILFC